MNSIRTHRIRHATAVVISAFALAITGLCASGAGVAVAVPTTTVATGAATTGLIQSTGNLYWTSYTTQSSGLRTASVYARPSSTSPARRRCSTVRSAYTLGGSYGIHQQETGRRVVSVYYDGSRVLWIDCLSGSAAGCALRVHPEGSTTWCTPAASGRTSSRAMAPGSSGVTLRRCGDTRIERGRGYGARQLCALKCCSTDPLCEEPRATLCQMSLGRSSRGDLDVRSPRCDVAYRDSSPGLGCWSSSSPRLRRRVRGGWPRSMARSSERSPSDPTGSPPGSTAALISPPRWAARCAPPAPDR